MPKAHNSSRLVAANRATPLNITITGANGVQKQLNIGQSIAEGLPKPMKGCRNASAYLHAIRNGCRNVTACVQGSVYHPCNTLAHNHSLWQAPYSSLPVQTT